MNSSLCPYVSQRQTVTLTRGAPHLDENHKVGAASFVSPKRQEIQTQTPHEMDNIAVPVKHALSNKDISC